LKAKSNEQFLAIGVNKPENAVKMSIQARTQGSYYYIDNISLVEVNDSSECSDKKDIKNIASLPEKNALDSAKVKPIILRDVFFEADKSELLPSSFKELDNLFSYLRTNKASKIEISGHTDNSGKEDHNLKLSKDRATAVSKYLIDKGIEATRISTKGYGSSKPIKPNTSEENRAINRRVEFRILT
jgi:outer membrane protein OmpA-like peptidoglycan-associated protein